MRATSIRTLAAAGVMAAAIMAGGLAAQAESLPPRNSDGIMLLAEAAPGHELVSLSEDGYRAVHQITWARLAIFEGQPAMAEKLLNGAKVSLGEAAKLADKLANKAKSSPGTTYIPIDAHLIVADDLLYTPEKAEHLKKVNELLKRGENEKAVEELRGGDILVNVNLALLPLEATQKAIDRATSLLAEGKYYEANLALKLAEDGVIIESQSLLDVFKASTGEAKKG